MPPEPVRYFNRYTGRVETESIYGERWIRWAYETPVGGWSLRAAGARAWFSRWYGWRMDSPRSRARVQPFIDHFGVNASEFADPPTTYRNFNEFFYRRLRADARPAHPDPRAVVFPADGRHLGFPRLAASASFFVKGQRFDLASFLRDPALARRFEDGTAVFSRLCPVDYHRFHFPVGGTPGAPRLIDGWLWSVNPIALRRRLEILWENRRWRCEIETPDLGTVVMVEIGASNVGSTEYTFEPGEPVTKGAEKGFFRFGGSAVMTLFEPGRLRLAEDLARTSEGPMELYARCGDLLGWRN